MAKTATKIVSAQVSEATRAELVRRARAEDRSISSVIRLALTHHLDHEGAK